MKKRTLIIIIASTLLLICVSSLLFLWEQPPAYFAEYDSPEEIHKEVISELIPNEASWLDVENTIETERFGSLSCHISLIYPTYPRNPDDDEKALICTAYPGQGNLAQYYIVFYFDNDVLVDVRTSFAK